MNKRGALIGGGVAVLVAIVAAAVWFGISSSDDESARPGIKKGDPAAEAADWSPPPWVDESWVGARRVWEDPSVSSTSARFDLRST